MAGALTVVVMFGALIPVIGAPIATLFAAVVALATEGAFTALLVVALTVIVGSFDGDVMQPLIMGHAVSLHPLAIVSAIAFGTLTFGIIGALIAVPILGTVYSVAKYLSGRSLPPRLLPPSKPGDLACPSSFADVEKGSWADHNGDSRNDLGRPRIPLPLSALPREPRANGSSGRR